jgi:hypothetical protein
MEYSLSAETNDVSQLELPEYFPTVSVSVFLGEQLRRRGQRIDIDLASLNDIMRDRGIPDDRLGDVNVAVKTRSESPRMRTRGEAWPSNELDSYAISLYVSKRQLRCNSGTRLHKTVIHESQHIADFMTNNFLEEPEKREQYFQTSNRRSIVGTIGGTLLAVAAIPEEIRQLTMPIVEHSQHDMAILMACILPPYSVLIASRVSYYLFYHTEVLERRAFRAQRATAGTSSHAIQFSAAT